jgi:hypothetical protein
MRGEHRPDGERGEGVVQRAGAPLLRDRGHRLGQPAVLGRPVAQAAHPVHLLGDVGEVEVGGERPDEHRRGLDRLVGQQRAYRLGGRLVAGFALFGQRADPLDEVERVLALLADQRLAEQRRDPADVGAQLGVVAHPPHSSAFRRDRQGRTVAERGQPTVDHGERGVGCAAR